MTPTDLDILLVTFFTWSLKVRFSSSVTPRNLTVEIFVRIEFRLLISVAFFWSEIIIYKVLLTFRESLLVLSQSSTPTSSLFTVALTLLMSLLDATLHYNNNLLVTLFTWLLKVRFSASVAPIKEFDLKFS